MTRDRSRIRPAILALVCLIGPSSGAEPIDEPPRAPEGFEVRSVLGWTVFVRHDLLKGKPDLAADVMGLLDHQLYQVARRLPPKALEKLRTVRIWVEEAEPHHPCMAYHVDPRWLRDHGMDPAKARCVEIANARNFLDWSLEQPWMILHELAHAYHHQFSEGGYDNLDVGDTFDRAMAAKLYDAVPGQGRDSIRAYAATNPMEYFAEATEAFYGANDFFPFVRLELLRHDRRAFQLLVKLWGDPGQPAR